jgi:hypothetical protein
MTQTPRASSGNPSSCRNRRLRHVGTHPDDANPVFVIQKLILMTQKPSVTSELNSLYISTRFRSPLMLTGHTIGETEGVALNSKKHLFVYTPAATPARRAAPISSRAEALTNVKEITRLLFWRS